MENGKLYPGDEGFVIPKSEFERIFAETGGDLAEMGKRLDLGRTLDPNTDIVLAIDRKDISSLKLPSGNEAPNNPDWGANRYWVPGAKTKSGTTEAVIVVPTGITPKEWKF